MSLDFSLMRVQKTEVFSRNITHNLTRMADGAGIYQALWRPDELIDVTVAGDLIPLLEAGLEKLKSDPVYFSTFNASNGWGMYEHFVPFVEAVLAACKEFPDATVEVNR